MSIDIIDIKQTDITLSEEGMLTFRASTNDHNFGFDMELFK